MKSVRFEFAVCPENLFYKLFLRKQTFVFLIRFRSSSEWIIMQYPVTKADFWYIRKTCTFFNRSSLLFIFAFSYIIHNTFIFYLYFCFAWITQKRLPWGRWFNVFTYAFFVFIASFYLILLLEVYLADVNDILILMVDFFFSSNFFFSFVKRF